MSASEAEERLAIRAGEISVHVDNFGPLGRALDDELQLREDYFRGARRRRSAGYQSRFAGILRTWTNDQPTRTGAPPVRADSYIASTMATALRASGPFVSASRPSSQALRIEVMFAVLSSGRTSR